MPKISSWSDCLSGIIPLEMDFVVRIIRRHIPIPARNGESLTEQVARFLALEAKQRDRQQLEARLEREKQFNRKVQLNATLRDLSLKLAELSAS